MIEFMPLEDGRLATRHSPLIGAIVRVLDYCDEHGGIELTPSKYFKRKFVNWAVIEFDWLGYTTDDLMVVNKVLNEIDVPPLLYVHELLLDAKVGRHYNGMFKLTKDGKTLIGDPARLFDILVPYFMFEYRHDIVRGQAVAPLGNWDVFLNVINVEAQDAITGDELFSKFYGYEDRSNPLAPRRESVGFYVSVLRHLSWAGLLEETRTANDWHRDRLYQKTPLWRAALKLDTDHIIQPKPFR